MRICQRGRLKSLMRTWSHGPVRLRDVEEAQQKIVNTIRKLEDAGEIIISGRR